MNPTIWTGDTLFGALVLEDKTTIFAVIAGYLLTLIMVGVVFRRFSKDTSDYFRAGGKATWWLMGGSVFMQAFSAWTFTGAAGAAFQVGWSLPVMFISNATGFLIIAVVTGAWFRQLRCVTAADLVRLRFGAGMEQFVAYLGMLTGPSMAESSFMGSRFSLQSSSGPIYITRSSCWASWCFFTRESVAPGR